MLSLVHYPHLMAAGAKAFKGGEYYRPDGFMEAKDILPK